MECTLETAAIPLQRPAEGAVADPHSLDVALGETVVLAEGCISIAAPAVLGSGCRTTLPPYDMASAPANSRHGGSGWSHSGRCSTRR
jgi:hypothetical protein